MASPPQLQPLVLDDQLAILAQEEEEEILIQNNVPSNSVTVSSPTTLSLALSSPEGIDCYGNERQALADQAKFYNNSTLSDITLNVGGNKYFAHKLILVRSSDVFERMLSDQWDDRKRQELELVEDAMCVSVFPRFLKFLYSCHLRLNTDNTLPVLVLADKYNVEDLRSVCINFACSFIIPKLQLKDVFHVWFQYSTKCYHRRLISSCVKALAEKMDDLTASVEWEQEWINLDKDQLIEMLRSSDLAMKDEYELWCAVVKWLQSPQHSSNLENYLPDVLQHIRFPMMTSEQLFELESSDFVEQHRELFQKYFMLAYKFHALPLTKRAGVKEFMGPSFLLRSYTDLRWDKRFVVSQYSMCLKCAEVGFRFTTKSSTVPTQTWEWELKVHPKGFSSTAEDFRCVLYSNLILDQPRPVEYLLSIVGKEEIIHSVCGRKNFSKTRYTTDTEMDKKVSVSELSQPDSPLLVENSLILQITLKPVE